MIGIDTLLNRNILFRNLTYKETELWHQSKLPSLRR